MASIMYSFKEALIDLVRERPSIWNKSMKDYTNRDISSANWITVTTNLGTMFPDEAPTVPVVKKMWQNLRIQYRNYLSAHKKSIKSGAAANEVFQSKWIYFNKLRFLDGGGATIETASSPLLFDTNGTTRETTPTAHEFASVDIITADFAIDNDDDEDDNNTTTNNYLELPDLNNHTSASQVITECPNTSSAKSTSTSFTMPLLSNTASGLVRDSSILKRPTQNQEANLTESPDGQNGGWRPSLQKKRKRLSRDGPDNQAKASHADQAFQATMAMLGKEDDDETKFGQYLACLLRQCERKNRFKIQQNILNSVFKELY